MPAQLLLVNPSKPRRPGTMKKPSAAQLAARARFAAMVRARANPGVKSVKRAVKKSAKTRAIASQGKNVRDLGALSGIFDPPSRRQTRVGGSKPKPPTPAQKAARARFAAAARARAGIRQNPFSERLDSAGYSSLAEIRGRTAAGDRRRARMKAAVKKAKAAKAAVENTTPTRSPPVARKKKSKTAKKRAKRPSKTAAKKPKRAKRAKKAKAKKTTSRKRRMSKHARASMRAYDKVGGGKRRRRRRKARKTRFDKVAVKLRRKAKTLRKRAKGKKGPGARIARLRASALSLRARARRRGKGGLSPSQKAALRAHGLMKVNPSIGGIIKDIGMLLPQVGATIAGLAGAAIAANKIVGFARSKMPTNTLVASTHAPAVVSGLLGVVGYIALRMIGAGSGKVAQFANKVAPAALIGGAAAATVHALSSVKDANGQAIGKSLGLPIGEYVVGDYVVGDYVVGSTQRVVDVDGATVRVNGLGNVFSSRTLGELPDPREGYRGTRGEPHMREMLEDVDDGSLAGNIFD